MLLQHGTADTMAPFHQSVRLHAALVAAGRRSSFDRFEGAEHFFVGCSDDEVRAIFQRAIQFAPTVLDLAPRPAPDALDDAAHEPRRTNRAVATDAKRISEVTQPHVEGYRATFGVRAAPNIARQSPGCEPVAAGGSIRYAATPVDLM